MTQSKDRQIEDRLLRPADAALMLGISERTLRRWMYIRKIVPVKLGRFNRLRLSDVQFWVQEGIKS